VLKRLNVHRQWRGIGVIGPPRMFLLAAHESAGPIGARDTNRCAAAARGLPGCSREAQVQLLLSIDYLFGQVEEELGSLMFVFIGQM
jgi:hypothetical protein